MAKYITEMNKPSLVLISSVCCTELDSLSTVLFSDRWRTEFTVFAKQCQVLTVFCSKDPHNTAWSLQQTLETIRFSETINYSVLLIFWAIGFPDFVVARPILQTHQFFSCHGTTMNICQTYRIWFMVSRYFSPNRLKILQRQIFQLF